MAHDDVPGAGDGDDQDNTTTASTPPAPPVSRPPARPAPAAAAAAGEEGPEDTSGRPPLAEVAAERASSAHTRIVGDGEEED